MSISPPGTEAAERPGGLYNTIPYDSMPFAQTQPSNLAALAMFFGLRTPPVASCRVLELGCASGGNIIPLAARFPEARFVGIDLSMRHVEIGRERVASLGLTNIDIRQGDLADPDVVAGEYDYIVCHGVFSWVTPAAQDGILNICGKLLARDGVAYISYNVLPGWQLRQIIRDIFLFHAGDVKNPKDRVARGRWLLEQLATVSSQSTPYGQLLRREAKQLSAMSESYIMGEFLVDENSPCYFHEFVARAEKAGLAYLSDTDLHTSLPEGISPELNQLLRAMAGPDVRMFEQYFDFFHGRQFRQTLLVRSEAAPAIKRTPDHRRIARLHFGSKLRLVPEQSNGQALVLRDPGGPTITTNDPAVAKALDHLGASLPETRSLGQLLDHLGVNGETERQAVADRVMAAILRVVMAGLGTMSAVPVRVGRAADAKPSAWPVARYEKKVGQPWTTNLRHVPINLDPVGNALLPVVDGHHDRAMMTSHLLTLVNEAKLDLAEFDGSGGASDAGDVPAPAVAARVELVLRQMEQLALLEPARPIK